MSNLISFEHVTAMAAQLSPAERRQLAEAILRELAGETTPTGPRRLWREIRGSAVHPLFGEDAQAWVSRTRRESDEQRERQGRRDS